MKFTLNRVIHYYYLIALIIFTSLFAYGFYTNWKSGILNVDFISNLYDGTNKVQIVKDRADLEEIKKHVENDRIKEAMKLVSRLEGDIRDLKLIKNTDSNSSFSSNFDKLKSSISALQSSPELAGIINSVSGKVTQFENFVTEKQWPTLTRMSTNLRVKIAQAKIISSGMYNFDRINNLSQSISNDLEAMTNFTEGSGLLPDIKEAIINRIAVIKKESESFNSYIEEHKKISKIHKDFSKDYSEWFKLVEPEIALKKIQFEKGSQGLVMGLVGILALFIGVISIGILVNNFANKRGSEKTEKLVLDIVKDELIPLESKNLNKISGHFKSEINKYHDYIHRRMTFGSIFQEAMPFASVLLDSNLNLVWGNDHFYSDWKLESFKGEGETLTWDFLQRFTNLDDNSSVLNALRLNNAGSYKIQVKTTSMNSSIPYEMHVAPVEYSGMKRIMVIFYPLSKIDQLISLQREAILNPIVEAIELQVGGKLSADERAAKKKALEAASATVLSKKLFEYFDQKELELSAKNLEIERLERELNDERNTVSDIRKAVVSSFEVQRSSIDEFNRFKLTVSSLIESRDQIDEQLKFTLNATREIYKDQTKILNMADKAEANVDDYVKSLKSITGLKTDFKELRLSVEDFKSRIVQVLDQLLVFQNNEGDTLKIDQFLGKIKIEMKGFERILYDFNQVVTQLDVTVTKLDMMVEGREKTDLNLIKTRMDTLKNTIDNIQFGASRLIQTAHSKDDDLIGSLRILVSNLKSEMRRVDEMCKLTGLTEERLRIISPANQLDA